MHFQATIYIVPLLLAAALSGVLALYAFRHRAAVGSLGFAAMTLAVTLWVLGYAFEIAGADLATKIFYAKLQYFGIVTVPVAWLVFALQFSQRQKWLTRRTILLLLVMPAITMLLLLSNETQHLLWRETSLDRSGPFLALEVIHGGWFWVHFGYSYLLILIGTILIGIAVVRMPHIYRQQALTVLVAALFPWVGNVLYLAGLNPIPQLDLTPFTFTLTSVIWAWSIFSFRLLDLAPVAREAVLEAMRDGVLTLDTQDRIVDMNPAAARMIGISAHQVVGRSAADVLGAQFDLLTQHSSDAEAQTELTVGAGATQRNIELRMSQIEDRHARPLGRLIMLRDITETKRADEERQKLSALIENSADFIGMATLEGQLLFLNEAGQRLVGLRDIEEARSKMMFDFIEATELPRFHSEIVPMTLRDGSWDGEISFHHFGGAAPVPVQFSVFLIKHHLTGEPLAVASVSRDITERRRAEQALQESEERFRRLAEAAFEGIAVHEEGRILDANQALADLFGYTSAELLGKRTLDLAAPEAREFVRLHMESESQDSYEAIGLRKDGSTLSMELSSRTTPYQGRLANVVAIRDITEQKRAEAAIRESEARFRQLTENIDQVFWLTSPDQKQMFYISPTYETVWGQSPQSFYDRPLAFLDAIHTDDRAAVVQAQPQMRLGTYDIEYRVVRPDGSIRWVWSRAFPIRDQAGEVYRIAGISEDITRHKENEHLLRVQANQIALLNDITRASIETRDLQRMLHVQAERLGKLLGADACYIDLWDQARREMRPFAASGLLHAAYPSLQLASNQPLWTSLVLEAGHTLVADDVLSMPQIAPTMAKRLSIASAIGLPLISGDSKFGAAMIAFSQPHLFSAEEIALAEQAARQIALAVANARLYQAITDEHSRLQAMITSSRDGVVLIGTDLRIWVINESAIRLLHMPGQLEEWTNRSMSTALELMHQYAPAAVSVTLEEMRRVQSGDERPGEGEYEVQSRVIHWLNLPVRAGVTALGRLLVLHDVTEERMLDRLRNDLTHTMVHDLRNPLTAMLGSLNIMQMIHDTESDTHDLLQIAVRSTKSMLGLVNAILDVSRLESGQMVLNCNWRSLSILAGEVFELQAPLANAKNLHIINALPRPLPLVWADDDLIRRVFQNLIGNAIKFTPAGGTITLNARLHGDSQSQLLVAISDTGPGIPEELRSRLFEKFVTGTNAGVGSGLGLAFCRLAIEAHGGKIWIESDVVQGTVFKFTLPTVQDFQTIQSALLAPVSAENG